MNHSEIRKVAVFCGANLGNAADYRLAAEKFTDVLIEQNITLVYGGANIGLMGTIAGRMLAQNGNVIGVIPKSLVDVEIAHQGLTQLHTVNSMHERKALIGELADGFIMLPGGAGSLDEFFEIFTWAQLGYHNKPCGILNENRYYDGLLKFLDHTVNEGFMKQAMRNMIIVEQSPREIIEQFKNYQAPTEKRWVKDNNGWTQT